MTINNQLVRLNFNFRYNLSHVEQWARDEKLQSASEALQPIVQAAQLLQARKQLDEDVNSVCDMCSKLSANQIVKILNLYTPADEYETRVPVAFIKKVQDKLQERQENNEQVGQALSRKFFFNLNNSNYFQLFLNNLFK